MTFSDDEVFPGLQALVSALSKEPIIRLGRRNCRIDQVTTSGNDLSSVQTWADITAPTSCPYISFEFRTPTAITIRDDQDRRFVALFPDPYAMFSGLVRRWNNLSGPPLPETLDVYLKTGGCVVSSYESKTVKFDTKNRTQIGFIGRFIYECRKFEKEHVHAVNNLARLAFFTGVGYQTARGMGSVKIKLSA